MCADWVTIYHSGPLWVVSKLLQSNCKASKASKLLEPAADHADFVLSLDRNVSNWSQIGTEWRVVMVFRWKEERIVVSTKIKLDWGEASTHYGCAKVKSINFQKAITFRKWKYIHRVYCDIISSLFAGVVLGWITCSFRWISENCNDYWLGKVRISEIKFKINSILHYIYIYTTRNLRQFVAKVK